MKPNDTSLSPGNRLPIYALRVWRIEPGMSFHVRTLSEMIFGLFVHWKQRRSVYCCLDECQECKRNAERLWKGYIAAEYWHEPTSLWYPVCFEITEHAELDMRHVYKRGQVWYFERPRAEKGAKSPVKATLQELLAQQQVPPDFDVYPCLANLYHRYELNIRQKNPLPDRVMVTPTNASPPAVIAEARRQAEEERINRRERFADIRSRLNVNGQVKPGSTES